MTANNVIRIDTCSVKKARGKSEFIMKPAATALGVTAVSYRSPILALLNRLLDEGKVTMEDSVEVYANTGTLSFAARTVAEWVDGRAMGRKPGSHQWLWKNRWKDDDDEDEE